MQFLDFFAGSGLVTEGMKPFFKPAWASDICPIKSDVYASNHDADHFLEADIKNIHGSDLPHGDLWWASFPCQDLSLAGKSRGIDSKRSGLVWHWLRLIDEKSNNKPSILIAENVTGLLTSRNGEDYRLLHKSLESRGYKVGPIILNAINWLPQSRARVFVIAVDNSIDISGFTSTTSSWPHPKMIMKACNGLENVIWWSLPKPPERKTQLADLIDFNAQCDPKKTSVHNISLISKKHVQRFNTLAKEWLTVAPGYKRTRKGQQFLELRFDKNAGCLRTPAGGSSRQFVVFPDNRGEPSKTRLLTARETARLMGASDTYNLPGSYNDGYKAMGDAVAVPVVHFLAENLLLPIANRCNRKTLAFTPEEKTFGIGGKGSMAIETLLEEFSIKRGFRGKAPLCVALVITRKAINDGLPIDQNAMLTEGEGQVQGLGKAAVQSILKDYKITRTLAEEGGRTSRGSIGKMKNYVAFLNELHETGINDLSKIEEWWINKVREFFAGSPFKLKIDKTRSIRSAISDLINQAQKRQQEMPGTTYAGTVAQHLVGAKLELIELSEEIKHHGASVADSPSDRDGDFTVGDTCIHVTTAPTEALIRKCIRNLDADMRPVIVTTADGVAVADGLASQQGYAGRIDVLEITQFMAINILEKSHFDTSNRPDTLYKIINFYNDIVDANETDPSLKIEIAK